MGKITSHGGRSPSERSSVCLSEVFHDEETIQALEDIAEQKFETKHERDRVALNYRSCFLFESVPEDTSDDFNPRRAVFYLTHHRAFEILIVVLIFGNCIFLALDDPVSEQPPYLRKMEYFFAACFFVELLLKVYSLGFVLHPGSYLRTGWNRLDFVIVTFSFLSFVPSFGNYTAIRTLRVLRPLRSINGIQGLKNIVNGLLHSLHKLVNVLVLAAFLFSIFGILGVQLWAGKFTYRCQSINQNETCIPKEVGVDNVPSCCLPNDSCCQETVVTDGIVESCLLPNKKNNTCGCRTAGEYEPPGHRVDWESFCTDASAFLSLGYLFGRPCESGYECVNTRSNPNYGFTNFDHFGYAVLAVFQCLTLEGWVDIMYIVQDVSSDLGCLYFILLVVLGSYFVLNLALAVINEEFDKIRREEEELQIQLLLSLQEKQEQALLLMVENDGEGQETASGESSSKSRNSRISTFSAFGNQLSVLHHSQNIPSSGISFLWMKLRWGSWYVVRHQYFTPTIIFFIVLNTGFLASEHHQQPAVWTKFLDNANIVLTGIFFVEMLLKLTASGVRGYLHDPFNVLDGSVVLLSILEFVLNGNSTVSVFRALRLLRVFKLLKNFRELRDLVEVILHAVSDTGYLNVIILLYIFCAALVGMQIFGGQFLFPEDCSPDDLRCTGKPRATFDSFYWSILTVFQVLTRDDWVEIMWNAMRGAHVAYCLYFLVLVICGDFVILNLFLAILIQSFDQNMRSDAEKEQVGDDSDLSSEDEPPPPLSMSHNIIKKGSTVIQDSSGSFVLSSSLNLKRLGLGHKESLIRTELLKSGYAPRGGDLGRGQRFRIPETSNGSPIVIEPHSHRSLSAAQSFAKDRLSRYSIISRDKVKSETRSEAETPPTDELRVISPRSATSRECYNNDPQLLKVSSHCEIVRPLIRVTSNVSKTSNISKQETDTSDSEATRSSLLLAPSRPWFPSRKPTSIQSHISFTSHSSDHTLADDAAEDYEVCKDFKNLNGNIRVFSEDENHCNKCDELYRFDEEVYHFKVCKQIILRKMRVQVLQQICKQLSKHITQKVPWNLGIVTSLLGQAWEVGIWLDREPSDFEIIEQEVKLHRPDNMDRLGINFKGSCVTEVRQGGYAWISGIRKGDIVSKVSLKEPDDILETITNLAIGRSVVLSLRRERDWNAVKHQCEEQLRILDLCIGEEMYGGALVAFTMGCHVATYHTNGGYSMFIFGPRNAFRIRLYKAVKHPTFEKLILMFILCSSVLMVLENPKQRQSVNESVLKGLDIMFTSIFVFECILKVIAFGFLIGNPVSENNTFLNGSKGSDRLKKSDPRYLKDWWNILDFCIVISAVSSLVLERYLTDGYNLSLLKVFRTFRALRPLRVISRNRGLRMVVITLLRSISSIGNVALVTIIVFLVFGILGVQLFGGKLYSCTDPVITHRHACVGWFKVSDPSAIYGMQQRRWKNSDLGNFDNIYFSMLTLFEVATLELWTHIMYKAIDGVSFDKAPRRDYNAAVGLFFIGFVVVGSFFIMNLFVGFVIFNFARVKSEEDGTGSLGITPEQKLWIETQRMMLNFKPIIKMQSGKSHWRKRLHQVCISTIFELIVGICILLNVVVMSLEHHGMNTYWTTALESANYVFSAFFFMEVVMKMLAFGKSYPKDAWNRFDLALVCLSVLQLTLILIKRALPVKGYILRVFRVFRVMRILRLVKSAKDVRILLETVWYSLPHIANIGAFLCLLFFIYAILGVNLFAKVRRGKYLNKHANYESFPRALLLLIRMVTGENWNGVMHETMVAEPDCSEAHDSCGTQAAPVYYLSFLLLATFILTNLFVAIILDNFRTTILIEKSDLRMTDLHRVCSLSLCY